MSGVQKKLNSRNSNVRAIDKVFGNLNHEHSDATSQSTIEVIEKKLTKICSIHEVIESNVIKKN